MFVCGSAFGAPPAAAETITLSDAIDRALRFAPSIAAAGANSDLSEAQMREQRAPLLPAIAAQGEYTQSPGYDPVISNRGQTDALLTLDYTAFDFGRRLAQDHAAEYAAEAARAGIAAASAKIAFDTKVAYSTLMRAMRVQSEFQLSVDRLSRYVATTKALVRSGKAIANDVLKVQVARDDAELSVVMATRDRERASIVLGSLVGLLDRTDLEAADTETIPPVPSGDLSASPVLAAAMKQVRAASLAQRAAEAERYPTFHVALSAGFLGIDPSNTFENRGGASYDGLVSVPLFTGGAISARIDEARARLREAEAAQRQIKLDLTERLTDASLRYTQAREAMEVLARAQPHADDAFALSWTRFLGGGAATMLEVLDAYEQAERLRLERIDQELAARRAAADAGLVLGFPN